MKGADAFLDRLFRAQRDPNFLSVFDEDPAGFGAIMESRPDALRSAMGAAVDESHGAPVTVSADSFVSAAYDAAGNIVVSNPRFVGHIERAEFVKMMVLESLATEPKITLIPDIRTGRPKAIAIGTLATARD